MPGLDYLMSLAVVSTTYVGFSALLVGLRQAKGAHLTSYDTYFTQAFIEVGFLVTVGGLVPSLLALYGLSPVAVWRISSAIVAIPILWFVLSLPRRRRIATGMGVPNALKLIFTLQGTGGVALIVNALYAHLRQAGAVYATVVTMILVSSGVAFLFALRVIRPGFSEPGEAADRS